MLSSSLSFVFFCDTAILIGPWRRDKSAAGIRWHLHAKSYSMMIQWKRVYTKQDCTSTFSEINHIQAPFIYGLSTQPATSNIALLLNPSGLLRHATKYIAPRWCLAWTRTILISTTATKSYSLDYDDITLWHCRHFFNYCCWTAAARWLMRFCWRDLYQYNIHVAYNKDKCSQFARSLLHIFKIIHSPLYYWVIIFGSNTTLAEVLHTSGL